eukprot:8478497-Lingulodinium_polyedra.AAC.1
MRVSLRRTDSTSSKLTFPPLALISLATSASARLALSLPASSLLPAGEEAAAQLGRDSAIRTKGKRGGRAEVPCCVILVLSQRARAVVTEAAAKLSLKLHEL